MRNLTACLTRSTRIRKRQKDSWDRQARRIFFSGFLSSLRVFWRRSYCVGCGFLHSFSKISRFAFCAVCKQSTDKRWNGWWKNGGGSCKVMPFLPVSRYFSLSACSSRNFTHRTNRQCVCPRRYLNPEVHRRIYNRHGKNRIACHLSQYHRICLKKTAWEHKAFSAE